MKNILLVVSLWLFLATCFSASAMNQKILEETVKNMAADSKGSRGVVEFTYHKIKMFLISDVEHDRMRIITPVVKLNELSRKHVDAALESNFHKSLDARYAVSNGVLYSAYIHPLSALSKKQIRSAVLQVSNLAKTFGSEYSSGILSFGGKKVVKKQRIKAGAI